MRKKLILWLIVCLEIFFGFLFLSWYRGWQQSQAQLLLDAKVSKIDQEKTMQNQEEELKYYYEFKPHEEIVDKVFWLKNDVSYKINNDGLNDINDYLPEKKAGYLRIVTIGDSFTYGQNVDTENNWSEVLEVMLNQKKLCGVEGFEVINLGMPGFDIQEMVRRYERVGQKYQPDIIIWFESGSGFIRFNEIMQPMVKECLGPESESLDYEVINSLKKLEDCFGSAAEKLLIEYSLEKRANIVKDHFNNFFKLPHTSKTIFYYYDFYYTERGYDYSGVIENWRQVFPQAKFFNDVPFKSHDDKYRFIDGHPNVQGHQLIAETIYNHLQNNGLFCPQSN